MGRNRVVQSPSTRIKPRVEFHQLLPGLHLHLCYRGRLPSAAQRSFHDLGLSGPNEVPTLFGRGGHWSNGYVSYSFPNLEAEIPFRGALLAGGGWDKDEWECIHPAEAFYRVTELTFEEGGRLRGNLRPDQGCQGTRHPSPILGWQGS